MKVKVLCNKLLIPIITVCVLILLILILSDSPLQTLYYFFIGPFRSIYSFTNMINAAVPLVFGALGICIVMKAGCLNLGGEGQVYLGSFVTVCFALALASLGAFGAVIACLLGCFASATAAAASGFLKARWNTNGLITSFLLSCAIIPVVNYFVSGPFLDPDTSLISTKKIAENMRLSVILRDTNLNTSVFIAVLAVIFTYFLIYKTRTGYELRISVKNLLFARYGGINTKVNTVIAFALSGFFYGLSGSVLVLSTHYSVLKEFSQGLGWNGLAVALIAGFNPVFVIPSALFFAWINTGARVAMQNTGLTYEVSYIVQAVIFFLAAAKKFSTTNHTNETNILKKIIRQVRVVRVVRGKKNIEGK